MQQPSHLDLDFLLSCVLSGCPYCRHFFISIIVAPNIFHPRIVYDDHALIIVDPNIFHPRIVYDDHALIIVAPILTLTFYSHAYYRDVHTAVIFCIIVAPNIFHPRIV